MVCGCRPEPLLEPLSGSEVRVLRPASRNTGQASLTV